MCLFRHHYRNPISEHCHRSFQDCDPTIPFVCSQCGKRLRIFYTTGRVINSMISHASVHINKDAYSCRYCKFGARTEGAIQGHVIRCHKLTKSSAHYNDLKANFQDDVIAMISRCFDANKKKEKVCTVRMLYSGSLGEDSRIYPTLSFNIMV